MANLEDKIDKAIKPLINMYERIENDLLVEIASHFLYNEEFLNSDYWRIQKLNEMGLFNQNVVNYIAKYSGKTEDEIKRALQQIQVDTINLDNLNKLFEDGMLKINPNILINNATIQNIVNLAYNELSKRFIQLSSKIEQSTIESYLNIVEEAYLKTSMGTHSYDEAIRSSIDELGNNGITTLRYKTTNESGKVVGIRNYDITGTVRREVLTASRQLANNINLEIANELECEYLYLSEHLQCRESHFSWQGTIIKKEDLVKITDYGSVSGLGGINCQHYAEAYFGDARGSELKTFTKEETEKAYTLSQKQRYLERGVRKWKRKTEMFKSNGDKQAYNKSKNKLKEWRIKTKDFTEKNEVKRDYTREYTEFNNALFKDNTIEKDFKKLDNKVEHLIIYDINTEKQLLKTTNNSNNSVGGIETLKLFLTSKQNSLVAVHNHPSNSSFSFTDISTFNKYKSINLIVVKTDKYFYFLEKNGINKVKQKVLKDINAKLRSIYFRKYGKNIETRHLINERIAKEIGWNYGRIERK